MPETWKAIPLKSRFDFGKGLSITKADLVEEGVPVLSYGQIHSKNNPKASIPDALVRYIPKAIADSAPDSLAIRNGFIFADTSEDLDGCGNCNYVDRDDVYGGYHTVVLKPKKSVETDNKYLSYLFQTDAWRYQLRKELTEVKLYSVSQKALKSTWIIVPPHDEKEAIVRYLDAKCSAIDEAIERHKKIIEKLEEYKRSSIIKSVNGDISDDPKVSGIAWMPAIPAHWDVVPMRFALIPRKNKNEGLVEQNLLTLSYGKIKRKDIDTNEGLLPASFEGYNIIEAGDIVLRLMDLQNDKHSLRTGLVMERGIITSAYVTVTPTEGFDSTYCRYLLHAYDLMKVFYSMGEGIRQGLTYDDLGRTLLIPKPPIDEQRAIASSIVKMESSVDMAIDKQNAMIEKLEEYRKSIIYNAVTGKIDCREAVK